MMRANESAHLDVPSPEMTAPAGADEAAPFIVWKSQLLRQLKSVDVAVKLALLLPLLLPTILLWSALYWFAKIKWAMWSEPSLYLFVILYVVVFPYFYFLRGIGKLSKRHKKKKFIDIDWSKQKYRELAEAITKSGIDIATVTGRLTVGDTWDIHTYPQARENPTPRKLLLLLSIFHVLALLLLAYRGAEQVTYALVSVPSLIFSVVVLIKSTVVIILDLFRPRFTLFLTTRVITYLKGEHEKFRLLIAHELSHISHKDPVRRVLWEQRQNDGRVILFWSAIAFVIATVVGWNLAPAWVFISCLLGWYIAHFLTLDLVPLFQELRSDLDAINSPSERELLLQLLRVIPIESKHEPYLNRHISLKQLAAVVTDASHHFRVDDQKEVMRQRIVMLETGELALIKEGRLQRKLLFSYAAAILTVIAAQIYLWRLATVS
jgi:hypothetical protein